MSIKVILKCRICHKRREVEAMDPGTYEVFYKHQEIIMCVECARAEELIRKNGNSITKEQRIRIGTLVMNTGHIKEAKEYMFNRFNVHSTKELTRDQADILIGKIEADLCHIP